MRFFYEVCRILYGTKIGVHREKVRDVVAAVTQWRLVERQQPQAINAEPFKVIKLGRDTS